MKNLSIYLLLVTSVLNIDRAFAQTDDYRIHSVFIYNFTKYFNWKNDAGSEFTIGVLGSTALKAELEKRFETKPFINDKRVVIKEFRSVDNITGGCQMLIIPAMQSGKLDDVLAKLNGKNTLVITDKEGLGKKGSGINFIKVDGKLRFELNRAALQKNNILASSEIEKLSILI
jgi:hypothetical protein